MAVTSVDKHMFLYYFLGRELQNELFYIPISKTGEIIYHGYGRRKKGDFGKWLDRLRENNIDFVVNFSGYSVELDWMVRHPDVFKLGIFEKDSLFALFQFVGGKGDGRYGRRH